MPALLLLHCYSKVNFKGKEKDVITKLLTVFKERTWPIAIATGWGFGVAYADAQVHHI